MLSSWLSLVIIISQSWFYWGQGVLYAFIYRNRLVFAESAKKTAQNIVLFSIINESGRMTQSLTTVLTWGDVARLKRTNAFMGEWRVGGKFWEFHFSSLVILAHTPTTYVEYSEPWMSSEKTSTHTSSYSKEAPWSDNASRWVVTLLLDWRNEAEDIVEVRLLVHMNTNLFLRTWGYFTWNGSMESKIFPPQDLRLIVCLPDNNCLFS